MLRRYKRKRSRILRIALSALIIYFGFGMDGAVRIVVVAVGLVPIAAELFDFCLFAKLFGLPLKGKDIRNLS